ncbi:malignant fibrous histiocytoma-amplified sequence 1 homolog [Stylophora pistillata]|nr:malignant fibrous histiocytoma-amplified sequence 1 homolog [Stylophora pistillata]
MVPVSNVSELTGIVALQKEIIRIAENRELFPSVGTDLPEEWVKLEMALRRCKEDDQVRCMSYADFEEFAKEHTGLSGRGLHSAVTYLDSIGELHYYNDIPSLYNNVFIDLRWLAKLVKRLFRHDLQETLSFDESFQRFGMIRGFFDELKTKLVQEALLSKALLRCLWAEIELEEAMFLQMVELLHHLGLACRLPSDDADNFNLFVPWFLTDYSSAVEALSESMTDDQAEINLLFMMSCLPPGLFDRLRVRCCSLGFDFYNWKDHVLLLGNDHRILIHKHIYPTGPDSGSPAIYIKGRGLKAELDSLWKSLLNIVEETDALLREWQRLSVQRCSLCPPCIKKKKAKPCLFTCNWMSHAAARKQGHSQTTKICKAGTRFLNGEKFDANLIFPPPDVVKQLLDNKWPQQQQPVSESVPDSLIADLSQKIPNEWKVLASYLGFNTDHVATFDQENTIIAEKVIAMFNAWKHNQGANATRRKLMAALRRVGRRDLAEKVCTYQQE